MFERRYLWRSHSRDEQEDGGCRGDQELTVVFIPSDLWGCSPPAAQSCVLTEWFRLEKTFESHLQ